MYSAPNVPFAPTPPADAIDQAERRLDDTLAGAPIPPLVVAIGLGHGELLDVLARRAPSTVVLAFEPDPDAASRLLGSAERRRWIDEGRLMLLRDPDYHGADAAWRVFPARPDDHLLVVHPAVAREAGPAAVRAARAFKQILFGARANAEARRRFAPGYLTGTLHNLPEIVAGRDVRDLADAYRGRPAVVIGAGPSLDETIGEIGRLADRAVLIAADTALRPLATHGIAPTFVVAVDPQVINARHFHALPRVDRTWLVSEASIDPSVVAPFDGRAFWFRVSHHEPWPWYNELGLDVGILDVWGSVLTAAFQLAVLAGCDPIVFAGADLAFTGGRPYCRGTTYEFDWAHVAALGGSIGDAWRPFLKPADQIRVPDLNGADTQTTGFLQSFRDWILTRATRSGRRVINASGAGILFGDGLEQAALADLFTETRAILPPQAIARRAPAPTSAARANLAHRVSSAREHLRAGADASSLHARWTTFCGGALDVDAVDAALARAARTLTDGDEPRRAETAPAFRWAAIEKLTAATTIRTRLPEAVARWRAILAGAMPLPALAAGDDARGDARDHLLSDAREILHLLCGSLCAAARAGARDLELPAAEHYAGRAPLSSVLASPVSVAWSVRLFEACLGGACETTLSTGQFDATFFSRPVAPHETTAGVHHAGADACAAPHAADACTLLTLEWLLAAALASDAGRNRQSLSAWWRSLTAALLKNAHRHHVPLAPVSIVTSGRPSPSVELALPHEDASMARVLTGLIRADDGAGTARATTSTQPASSGETRNVLVVPRVLTDEGLAHGVPSCETDRGVVCVIAGGTERVLVREDGSIEPLHARSDAVDDERRREQSARNGWAATVVAEADAVRVERGARAVTMRCYGPRSAAWAGGSLLVATIDGDLLLFERLQAILDGLVANAFAAERDPGAPRAPERPIGARPLAESRRG